MEQKKGNGGNGSFEQAQILRRGVEQWNQWKRANLLTKVDLAGIDLKGANLKGVDLSVAILSSANLEGADLQEAKLRGANLKGAKLQQANLSHADLKGANLQQAKLEGATLRGANLQQAELWEAKLEGVDLEGAKLEGADLDEAIFRDDPIRIFTKGISREDSNELFERAKDFAAELGLEVVEESEWREGSLWKDAVSIVKGLVNSEKVQKRTDVAENVLLGKGDIETTVELTKAVVELEQAFKGKKGAIAIDTGPFPSSCGRHPKTVMGDTYFKRLTLKERRLLNNDPTLLGDPEGLFDKIKELEKLAVSEMLPQEEKNSFQPFAGGIGLAIANYLSQRIKKRGFLQTY